MTVSLMQPGDEALRRFAIIGPLLHPSPDDVPWGKRIEALAERRYVEPDGRQHQYGADTIRNWIYKYNAFGIEGLRNKPRSDTGTTSVPKVLQDRLRELRRQHPRRTTKKLLGQCKDEGIWDGGCPSRSAIYRFTATHGLNRNTETASKSEAVRPFEYPCFGDLWSADFLHGPKVRRGTHRPKAYLHVIIDDATRYVVAGTFHLAENTAALLADLMLALRRFGLPRRFYTDNGAAFRSRHLHTIAARFAIALPHTPPYKPRGRGKVERFFRRVREEFLDGHRETTLDALNRDFAAWINTYHQTPHASLGMSPLDRKMTDEGDDLKQIDPTQNINDLFRMETTRVVGNDGCVRMWNTRFQVPDAIPRERITVHYLPWARDYLLVGPDKLIAKPVRLIQNARRFEQPRRGHNGLSQKGE